MIRYRNIYTERPPLPPRFDQAAEYRVEVLEAQLEAARERIAHLEAEAAWQQERIAQAGPLLGLVAASRASQLFGVFGRLVTVASTLFDVPTEAICGPSRKSDVARARFAVMWVARRTLGLSYPRIGSRLGRDHGTVIHGVDRATKMRAQDPDFRDLTDALAKALASETTGGSVSAGPRIPSEADHAS